MILMRLNDILDAVTSYAPEADLDLLMRAYVYSARAHAGQLRKSGEPYLIHPIAVAGLLANLQMDVDTIATGLLHDTMEDCLATRDELAEQFGSVVADMVDGVTKIGKLEFRSKEEAQAENFRKLVLAMSADIRIILVKLADRLHNMRTMEHMKADRQRAISQETIDIYAPIANRLGLSTVKTELEELCFRYLHPDTYDSMVAKLGAGEAERTQYIDSVCSNLNEHFTNRNFHPRVYGRPKNLYSVYRKMLEQNLEFEQVHDLLGFRVIVTDIGECYVALGLIHASFRHLPAKLKDYIANPKSNGYQSLHTVVMGPENRQIEIQIRTADMHRVAEVGIAAHWRYKEGHLALSSEDISKIAKLRTLFEAANEVDDPSEFLETVKVDLFSEEIFAFTPQGDVKFFPRGATVLDFAYAIHTEVGNHCSGCIVNGRMVPLKYVLSNGDSVEIITKTDQNPHRDWLQIAKTGRALSKIRRHIREEVREKGRTIGRDLLETELKKRRFSLNKMLKSNEIKLAARQFGFRQPDQLFLALAQGDLGMNRILKELLPADALDVEETEESENAIVTFINKIRRRSESPVLINGQEDVLVSYARCCSPLPGEPVSGYITRGRGITVHVGNCPQLLAMESERRIPVEWQRSVKGQHSGELRLICSNEPGMLAEIGNTCKTSGINVTRLEATSIEDNKACLYLEVSVHDVEELSKLIRHLEKIKGVLSADRIRAAQADNQSSA